MRKIKGRFEGYTGDLFVVGRNEIKRIRENGRTQFQVVAKAPKGYIVMFE